MNIVYSETGRVITGYTQDNHIDYAISETPEIVPASESDQFVTDDIIVKRTTDETTVTHLDIASSKQITIDILSGDGITAEAAGNRVVDLGNTPDEITYRLFAPNCSSIVNKHEFTSEIVSNPDSAAFVAGTLGEHVMNQALALLDGKTASNATQAYITASNNDLISPSVTINPNFFLAEVDFSGVTVMTDQNADGIGDTDDRYAPALISPRHALVASHVDWAAGQRMAFKKRDVDEYVVANVVREYKIPDRDLDLLYLDVDVTGCKIYKILPMHWERNYVPSIYNQPQSGFFSIFPIFRKAMHFTDDTWGSAFLVNHIQGLGATSVNDDPGSSLSYGLNHWEIDGTIKNTYPSGAIGSPWEAGLVIPGDSGSPAFCIVNNEPILVMTIYTTHQSVNISSYTDVINEQMNILADTDDPQKGTYALLHPDLSMFTNYGV